MNTKGRTYGEVSAGVQQPIRVCQRRKLGSYATVLQVAGIPTGVGCPGIHVPSPLEKDIHQAVFLEDVVDTLIDCVEKFPEDRPVGGREEHVRVVYATANEENVEYEQVGHACATGFDGPYLV